MSSQEPRLIAHVIFRLQIGGLENGLVNIINGLPRDRFRHAVICIDTFTDFRERICSDDVPVIAINRKPGRDPGAFFRLLRVIRELRPDIIHTRNLAALDALLPAFIARVPFRIHSEHGRDMDNLDGSNAKQRILRKLHRPLVHRYIAVSPDLADYLRNEIRVDTRRIEQITNGVDTERFFPPRVMEDKCLELKDFCGDRLLIGTVGRLDHVKDQVNFVQAVATLFERRPELRGRLCLAIAGDGPARPDVKAALVDGALADVCWLPGGRSDVPQILRTLDLFVLPSLAEGISNTILEAMATGLPIVATRVGGNDILVRDGINGSLAPAANPRALADAIESYVDDADRRALSGEQSRRLAVEEFSLERMISRYQSVYETSATTT